MRKRIVSGGTPGPRAPEGEWLDLEALATVEVTSEDAAHPIENALVGGSKAGWRAGAPGGQTIRLIFEVAQRIRRIDLQFEEKTVERTQELAIAWTNAQGDRRDLRRQRWNFSPGGSTLEHEDFRVELEAAKELEIVIEPDVSDGSRFATLRTLRLA